MELGALGFELATNSVYLFQSHEKSMKILERKCHNKIPVGLQEWIEKCLTKQITQVQEAFQFLKQVVMTWLSTHKKKFIACEIVEKKEETPGVESPCITLCKDDLISLPFLRRFFFSSIFPSHKSLSEKLYTLIQSISFFQQQNGKLPVEFTEKIHMMQLIVFRAAHYAFSSVHSEEIEKNRKEWILFLQLPMMTHFVHDYFQIQDYQWYEICEKTRSIIGLVESMEENSLETILRPTSLIQLIMNETWSVSIYRDNHYLSREKWIWSYPYRTFIYNLIF
jgi:hypothetical protein